MKSKGKGTKELLPAPRLNAPEAHKFAALVFCEEFNGVNIVHSTAPQVPAHSSPVKSAALISGEIFNRAGVADSS